MNISPVKTFVIFFSIGLIQVTAQEKEEKSIALIAFNIRNPPVKRVIAYHALAELNKKKHTESAITYARSAKKLIPPDSLHLQSINTRLHGALFINTTQLDSAALYLKNALSIDSILTDYASMAESYNGLSVIAIARSNYQKGIEYSYKTLEMIDKDGTVTESSIIEYNLAMLYLQVRNYPKAKVHHKSALHKAFKVNDTLSISRIYGALSSLYLLEKNPDSAEVFLTKILELNKGDENKDRSYHHLKGKLFYQKADYKAALRSFDLAEKLSQSRISLAYLKRMTASTYLKTYRYEKALSEIQEMDSLIGNRRLVKLRQFRDSLYGAAYSGLNDNGKARFYRERYRTVKDSLFSIEKIHAINNIEDFYLDEKRKRLITEQEGVVKRMVSQNKILTLSIAIGIFVFGFIATRLYLKNRKVKKENLFFEAQYKEVSTKNLALKNQLLTVSENANTKAVTSNDKKYEHSSLSTAKRQEIINKIVDYMEAETPYLDSELSQKELSKKLGMTSHHLSEVLNLNLGKNFYGFINMYRVAKAKEILKTDTENLTMLAVAFDSGFNSKPSFNRIFKKTTGSTPSQFKDSERAGTS